MTRSLLVLVAAASLVALPGAANAGYAGADGAITFDNGTTIYSLDHGKLASLVSLPDARAFGGIWSPNGRSLAFVRYSTAGYAIETLDVSTHAVQTVVDTKYGQLPTWSPDGSELAYACDDLVSVCLVSADGKSHNHYGAVGEIHDVMWSSTGQLGYIAGHRVYVAAADGSSPVAITPDETQATSFAWSPDGAQIAYTSGNDLDLIGANGRNWHVIDEHALGQRPSWSPDGQWIVFQGMHDTIPGLITLKLDESARPFLVDPASGFAVSGDLPDWESEPHSANPPSVTGRPTISGTPLVGKTLTAEAGTWNGDGPLTFAYAWQRCDAHGASCTTIATAGAASYGVTAADVGRTLRVDVTASNAGGHASSGSDATAVVHAPNAPPAVRTATGVWTGSKLRVAITACDDGTTPLNIVATDWAVVAGRRVGTKSHSWSVGGTGGCATATRSWPAFRGVGRVHDIAVRVRDAQGAWSSSVRVEVPA